MKGIPTNPEELDDYYKNKGPIPAFNNEFGCIQDVVAFALNASALGQSKMLTGEGVSDWRSSAVKQAARAGVKIFSPMK